MGLTDTIRNKVNSLFNFDSQQQSNQLKTKLIHCTESKTRQRHRT